MVSDSGSYVRSHRATCPRLSAPFPRVRNHPRPGRPTRFGCHTFGQVTILSGMGITDCLHNWLRQDRTTAARSLASPADRMTPHGGRPDPRPTISAVVSWSGPYVAATAN